MKDMRGVELGVGDVVIVLEYDCLVIGKVREIVQETHKSGEDDSYIYLEVEEKGEDYRCCLILPDDYLEGVE